MAITGRLQSVVLPTVIFFLLFYIVLTETRSVPEKDMTVTTDYNNKRTQKNNTLRYKVVTVNFPYVEVPYVICLWILLASVAKIGFHLYDKLPHIFPESCLLIVLGIIVGVTLHYTETARLHQYSLDSNIFFLFLLPPIVFNTGFSIPNRPLFDNIGSIALLAVINTLWNTLGIGVCLWYMSYLGWINQKIGVFNGCVFGALISAVDPAAVLSIFEEVQINEILYIIVFGESLLNDGVTVVMYRMMVGFTAIGEKNLLLVDYAAGLVQFFVVILGGALIGIIVGVIGVFITKYTDHVRIMEPLFIFVIGYLGYLSSEIFGLSSILALTFCGIIMKHYSETNMARKSTTTIKYFLKMMATISETIIFMFLGLTTISYSHEFQLDFILFSILFCLLFRVTGVVVLCFLMNRRRLIRLSPIDQFMMSYGGLRGGVAFCLALALDSTVVPEKALFVTTTMVIIYFTVFIQGITIKPIVNALKVERAGEKYPSMNEIIHKRFIDHLMAGMEDIIGISGYNSFHHKFDYYNTKYLKPLLLREKSKVRDPSIIRTFKKLSYKDAKATILFPDDVPHKISSFAHLDPGRPAAASLFSRRATISVPRYHSIAVNLHSLGPFYTNTSGDGLAMQNMLKDSMLECGHTCTLERRHTLAEIHRHQPSQDSEHGPYRCQSSVLHKNRDAVEAVTNFTGDRNNYSSSYPTINKKKLQKTVSFSEQFKIEPSDEEEISAEQRKTKTENHDTEQQPGSSVTTEEADVL